MLRSVYWLLSKRENNQSMLPHHPMLLGARDVKLLVRALRSKRERKQSHNIKKHSNKVIKQCMRRQNKNRHCRGRCLWKQVFFEKAQNEDKRGRRRHRMKISAFFWFPKWAKSCPHSVNPLPNSPLALLPPPYPNALGLIWPSERLVLMTSAMSDQS
jgi:hypothetical protein